MKQRENKFRAWDKKSKKFYPFSFGTMYGYEGEVCGVLSGENGSYGGVEINFNSGYGFNGINPDIEIVEFTGLHDKNGKDIYEGDIVSLPNGVCPVTFEDGCFYTILPLPIGRLWLGGWSNYKIEVIGNIYENPELIKETR